MSNGMGGVEAQKLTPFLQGRIERLDGMCNFAADINVRATGAADRLLGCEDEKSPGTEEAPSLYSDSERLADVIESLDRTLHRIERAVGRLQGL